MYERVIYMMFKSSPYFCRLPLQMYSVTYATMGQLRTNADKLNAVLNHGNTEF